jgi:hypothetical protein
MPRTLTGSMAVSRVSISLAALLVKVTARMPPGVAWPVEQQPGDARGQHAGLARTGARQNQRMRRLAR